MVADEHTFWFAYKFVQLILASYQYVNKARLSHSVKTGACNECHFFPRLLTNNEHKSRKALSRISWGTVPRCYANFRSTKGKVSAIAYRLTLGATSLGPFPTP